MKASDAADLSMIGVNDDVTVSMMMTLVVKRR